MMLQNVVTRHAVAKYAIRFLDAGYAACHSLSYFCARVAHAVMLFRHAAADPAP